MSVNVNTKIVGWTVLNPGEKKEDVPPTISKLQQRPELLIGKTYKLKTPLSDHALYITINDLDGKPFEIFINSKAMEHFQWVVALTRLVSAVFRHGGEVTFLIEELRSVFDPKGGYFAKGRYVPSLVAAIGDVVERHLIDLGLHQRDESLVNAAKAMIAEKQGNSLNDDHSGYPDSAVLCVSCATKAVVISDGCAVCLACGESKCS